ncbi:MAG: cytochrome C biogenesis protein [Clostridiales bacterium]|nr:MAG: cytochrome C biogenesis protein [Clostridiales bacterium]
MSNLIDAGQVNFLLVFLEGILSFFSPCVIPLIPVYIGYLAGNAKHTDENGVIRYERKKVFFHTVFFVLGISFAFFILGLSFTAIGSFFGEHRTLMTRLGGILIVLLGLFQVGFLDFKFLQREHKLHPRLNIKEVNPLIAFVMGFTFSFAWTPCVGPALSSVLIMASGAKSAMTGNLLVLVYALGFVIPFLLLGLFTTQVLEFLRGKQKLLKYTVKAGGVLLILIGIITFTGWMNGVSGYLSSLSLGSASSSQDASEPSPSAPDVQEPSGGSSESSSGSSSEPQTVPGPDFTLSDQFGNEHTLSDYQGKVVLLNFWTTWCTYCKKEMPDLQELYEEYGNNEGDVVILGVANPRTGDNPNAHDSETLEGITKFLENGSYTYPVVMDLDGEVFYNYGVNSYPTTVLLDMEGNMLGYAPGALTKDILKNALDQAVSDGKKDK